MFWLYENSNHSDLEQSLNKAFWINGKVLKDSERLKRWRLFVDWAFHDGMTYKEVSKETGRSVVTSRQFILQYFRMIALYRIRFEDELKKQRMGND